MRRSKLLGSWALGELVSQRLDFLSRVGAAGEDATDLIRVKSTVMARIAGWLGELVSELNWGCENSPYIKNLQNGGDTMAMGRELCLVLWPFISQLPSNVSRVRHILPDSMTACQKFFDQLKDDELYYQGLYMQQCTLTGLNKADLDSYKPDEQTLALCELMQKYCASPDYHDGVLAIVAAELAATCFARHSQEYFENFFENLPEAERNISLEDGLAWLRLHAKPHPKHALWLMRTIEAIDARPPSNKMPEPVIKLIDAIHQFLKSEQNGKRVSHSHNDFLADPQSVDSEPKTKNERIQLVESESKSKTKRIQLVEPEQTAKTKRIQKIDSVV